MQGKTHGVSLFLFRAKVTLHGTTVDVSPPHAANLISCVLRANIDEYCDGFNRPNSADYVDFIHVRQCCNPYKPDSFMNSCKLPTGANVAYC